MRRIFESNLLLLDFRLDALSTLAPILLVALEFVYSLLVVFLFRFLCITLLSDHVAEVFLQ